MKKIYLLLSLFASLILAADTRPANLGDVTVKTITASGNITAANLSGTNTGNETSATIAAALGYTPMPNTSAAIAAALGYTPMANTSAAIAAALGYTPESISNKATDFSTINDTKYPTVKAVDDRLKTFQPIGTAWLCPPLLTVNSGDSTKFDISAGKGIIFNYNCSSPSWTYVEYPGATAVTPTYLNSNPTSNIVISTAAAIVQLDHLPTAQERRNYLYVGALLHNNLTNLNGVQNEPVVSYDDSQTLRDLCLSIGVINTSGNVISANGANLNINKSAGEFFRIYANYQNSATFPNRITSSASSPASFLRGYYNGTAWVYDTVTTSTVPVTQYNNTASGLVSVSPNKFLIHNIRKFPGGVYILIYGQTQYDTMDLAVSGLSNSTLVDPQLSDSFLLCRLIVKTNATDLSDTAQAKFVQPDKFGQYAAGSGGGGSGTGEANTASNVGTGTGWYYTKSGVDLQFKSITSTGGIISITDNTTSVDVGVTDNTVTNAKLSQMAANTVKANITGSTANAADVTKTDFVNWLGVTDLPAAADVTDNGLPFNVPAPQGGNDSYTKLLLNFDGNATDSAVGATEAHTPTNTGVTFVTGKFNQGGNFSAAYEITYPSSDDFDLPGDFTIDFWLNPASTGDSGLFTLTDGSTYGLTCFIYSNAFRVIADGGYVINGSAGPTASSFQHVALVRSGTTLTLYKNGTSIGSATYSTSISSTGNLRIGYTAAIPAYANGTIDAFRVSQYARWTTNFTPPTVAYSSSTPMWEPAVSGTPSSASEIIYRDPTDNILKYAAASAFPYVVNPMTTVGDMIVGGTSGAPTRVAAGTSGYVWTAQGAGAAPVWAAATGVGKVIVSGNGYILDNGSSGRGTIGTKAVSLNYADYGTDYGAIGDYSGVLSGRGNKCDGNYSVIAGGGGHASDYSNTINSIAEASFIGSGVGNIANAAVTSISGGSNNKTNSQYSSIPGGLHALCSNYAEFSISSGYFSAIGDCQRGSVQARNSTTTTDPIILYLDGVIATKRFVLATGDSYTCRVTIFGKQADGSCGDAVYQVKIKNVSGTTSLSGTVRSILAWEGDTNLGSPTISITADDTNDALQISVTAANTTETRWTAAIDYVKINY